MPTFRLSSAEWTTIVPAGGNADKQAVMNAGRAEVRFLLPQLGEQAIFPMSLPPERCAGSSGWDSNSQLVVPAPAGLEARAVGAPAVISTGDW